MNERLLVGVHDRFEFVPRLVALELWRHSQQVNPLLPSNFELFLGEFEASFVKMLQTDKTVLARFGC